MWEASPMFLLLCLPSGCGHPFGSIVSFVTIDRERRFPLEVVSCARSPPIYGLYRRFPTSSVGLSGLLVAGDHAFTWLVTVLANTLSSPCFLCCLARCLRCAALLPLWWCAHSLLGLDIPRLLACPSTSNRL